jgi:hypothetical protein
LGETQMQLEAWVIYFNLISSFRPHN